jgi:hypothetical protein
MRGECGRGSSASLAIPNCVKARPMDAWFNVVGHAMEWKAARSASRRKCCQSSLRWAQKLTNILGRSTRGVLVGAERSFSLFVEERYSVVFEELGGVGTIRLDHIVRRPFV